MSVVNPSENLIHLVKYMVKVYAPMWFEIKRKPQCYDGPRHFWQALFYSRYLEEPLRKIIDKVFIKNAYFAHQENIVLAMLFAPSLFGWHSNQKTPEFVTSSILGLFFFCEMIDNLVSISG